jgi:hypothetical protein
VCPAMNSCSSSGDEEDAAWPLGTLHDVLGLGGSAPKLEPGYQCEAITMRSQHLSLAVAIAPTALNRHALARVVLRYGLTDPCSSLSRLWRQVAQRGRPETIGWQVSRAFDEAIVSARRT